LRISGRIALALTDPWLHGEGRWIALFGEADMKNFFVTQRRKGAKRRKKTV